MHLAEYLQMLFVAAVAGGPHGGLGVREVGLLARLVNVCHRLWCFRLNSVAVRVTSVRLCVSHRRQCQYRSHPHIHSRLPCGRPCWPFAGCYPRWAVEKDARQSGVAEEGHVTQKETWADSLQEQVVHDALARRATFLRSRDKSFSWTLAKQTESGGKWVLGHPSTRPQTPSRGWVTGWEAQAELHSVSI